MATLFNIIESATSWKDIYNNLIQHNTSNIKLAGKLFEEFCKLYYLTEPSLKAEYKNVWLFTEAPTSVKTKLNLGKIDHGIDLILEDHLGAYSVVQCKFRNDQSSKISWSKDKIANLYADGDKADYLIVFTNASGLDQYSLNKTTKLKLVTLGDLVNLSKVVFEEMKEQLLGKAPIAELYKEPRDYQVTAINEVINGFKESDRGQLILPCGAGKTLVSLWIKEALKSKHTLVLVPSLALLRQTKKEWGANSTFTPYLCVCSEKDIDKGKDVIVTHTYDIGGMVTTNTDEIKEFLNKHDNTIIYSTYQSLAAICAAVKSTGFKFDLAICDEAHKTSGSLLGDFAIVHSDANILIKKRLYMTATPRVIATALKMKSGDDELQYLYDMDNQKIFGKVFHRMSFKEAIDQGILVDYKIVSMGVESKELEQALKDRRFIGNDVTLDEIANNYALEKFMQKYGATHAITFHSSIRKAKAFKDRHKEIYPEINIEHINGMLTTNERNVLLNEFERAQKSVMTNARCLTEGIDVPAIDAVYFCDPKNSKIDIVQATGRALRRADNKGKKQGYIVVPIFHSKKDEVEKIIESSAYSNLISVIRALYSHDERLVEEIRNIRLGKGVRAGKSNRLIISELCNLITLENFEENLKEKLFDQVISKLRVPWRSFEQAREFARNLGLKTETDWRVFYKEGKRPIDIPSDPRNTYRNIGWVSWGDWLGNTNIAPTKKIARKFTEARTFVRSLNLKNGKEWREYCKSGKRPYDIPSNPNRVYKNQGWISNGDWLGTNYISNLKREFIPFEEAVKFVYALKLSSMKEWNKYCKSGSKPNFIPTNPKNVYENNWVSWGHWLGTNSVAPNKKEFLPFYDAKLFVHKLSLKSEEKWREYCKSGRKPVNIPSAPGSEYKNKGWKSWSDWLGNNFIPSKERQYLSFKDAKQHVKKLGLKSARDWYKYAKSSDFPSFMPYNPNRTYRLDWISWGDWLGTESISVKKRNYLTYNEAKKYVVDLSLPSEKEWRIYCKSGNKPDDIPTNPYKVYKNRGWVSWPDWLGK